MIDFSYKLMDQGSHMSCSYSDIAMAIFDNRAENYFLKPTVWKSFRDGVFTVWTHGIEHLPNFLEFLNGIDKTGKIKFTMQIADDNGLEFLDLKLKLEGGKISVDVYSKPTNSFTYVLPNTCYPKRSINNIPRGIALRLKRICDSEKKFADRSNEYKNYLIARDYKSKLVDKHFKDISTISRSEARKVRPKQQIGNKVMFTTTCNPCLPDIKGLIKKHLPILHNDDNMKILFPENYIYSDNFKISRKIFCI